MKKTFVKIEDTGELGAVITSNDPTLIITPDMLDITDDENKDIIKTNSSHFKSENGLVIELSDEEKKIVDKKKESMKIENPILKEIQKINERLDKLEKKLKD
jgi:hypothetical protein